MSHLSQARKGCSKVAASCSRLVVSLASAAGGADKMSTSNPRQTPVSSAAFWWLWSRDGVFGRLQRRGSWFLRCCVCRVPARALYSQGPPIVLREGERPLPWVPGRGQGVRFNVRRFTIRIRNLGRAPDTRAIRSLRPRVLAAFCELSFGRLLAARWLPVSCPYPDASLRTEKPDRKSVV